jgi:uncharacterized membrane protein
MNASWNQWQRSFLAGLAVVLPAVVSIALLVWLFGTISTITDLLLFFLPPSWTHQRAGEGPMYWYWSLVALLLGLLLVSVVGRLARNYAGAKLIELVDQALSTVPLLNKIYGTVKQVNEAFATGKRSAFQKVVLVEFPRPGLFCVGFITSEGLPELDARTGRRMVCVFVPTTPNPTSGFMVLAAEEETVPLQMSVAEGIRYVVSLGAVSPGSRPGDLPALPGAPEGTGQAG